MDLKTIKSVNHYLFDNLEEYKAFGNSGVVKSSWRNGDEGDWVYTDDGYICQILKKSSVSHPGYKKKRTIKANNGRDGHRNRLSLEGG